MTDKETQASAGVASVLNAELDVEDGLMCVWFENTEISHLLRSHINDQGNMEDWQDSACVKGVETIDRLRAEVKRLREIIKKEADYCYKQQKISLENKDYFMASKYKKWGDKLMSNI